MSEWTDEEVYDQLAKLTRRVENKEVLTLADIEAVLFDPRFPARLEPAARRLLQRFIDLSKPKQ